MRINRGAGRICSVSEKVDIYGSIRFYSGPTIRPGAFKLTERAISQCRFGDNPRLLDVGCGTGATARFLREKFGYSTIALDISPTLFSGGSENTDTFPFIQGDARQLPLGDRSMDGIISECVISILEKPQLAIAEFSRVLTPGGFLMITDLYDRGCNGPYGHSRTDGGECLKGIQPRFATENLLLEAGFEPLIWEDHTDCLKHLAAQLVLNGFGADDLCGPAGVADSVARLPSGSAPVRPGYYLSVARKCL